MPFSQTYPMCCINIRNFVDQFYQFTDGVVQQHLDIDEVLRKVSCIDQHLVPSQLTRKSLDGLLTDHVSSQIVQRLSGMSNLSQIAQIVVNIEHFGTACEELEGVLMGLRWVVITLARGNAHHIGRRNEVVPLRSHRCKRLRKPSKLPRRGSTRSSGQSWNPSSSWPNTTGCPLDPNQPSMNRALMCLK